MQVKVHPLSIYGIFFRQLCWILFLRSISLLQSTEEPVYYWDDILTLGCIHLIANHSHSQITILQNICTTYLWNEANLLFQNVWNLQYSILTITRYWMSTMEIYWYIRETFKASLYDMFVPRPSGIALLQYLLPLCKYGGNRTVKSCFVWWCQINKR